MRFKLYHGSKIWTCRTYLKSSPSDAAREINITRTSSPFIFASLVAYLISAELLCEKYLSPDRIMYFAWLNFFLMGSAGIIVAASIGGESIAPGLKRGDVICDVPYRVNPISSSANETATIPPSMYCVYTMTIPRDFWIHLQISAIFELYLGNSEWWKMRGTPFLYW